MPLNDCYILSVDVETTGLKPGWAEVCQLGAVVYDGRTLESVPAEAGGVFDSLLKPLHFDRIQDQALAVNKLTREQLEKAPCQRTVWHSFVEWTKRWRKKGVAGFPILLGKNCRNFDRKFLDALNELHGPGKQMWNRITLDLEDPLFLWFEDDSSLGSYKLDEVRDYVGLSKAGAHTAVGDARQTGDLFMRFLKLHRELRKREMKDGTPFIKLKGCLAG